MKKGLFIFLIAGLISCKEDDSLEKGINDTNLCTIDFVENCDYYLDQATLFKWDSITHNLSTVFDPLYGKVPVHSIKATSYDEGLGKNILKFYIPVDQFEEGKLILGQRHFTDPILQYNQYTEWEGHGGYVPFFNYQTPVDDRKNKGEIKIIDISSDSLLIEVQNLDMYRVMGGGEEFSPCRINLDTKFMIVKK